MKTKKAIAIYAPPALLAVALLGYATLSAAHGQLKPVTEKGAATQKASPKQPIVLGTNQLPGEFGQFGQTYTIGQREPINFTLKSAEYSITPFSVANNTWVPQADQKLLILHFAVHNPNPREFAYDWWSVKFTAVDSKDVNHEFIQIVAREGTNEKLGLSLKPAQKVDAVAAILVPSEGIVPKLIVEREKGAAVVRYDLHGKAKPLSAGIADAGDTTGATPLKEIPAQPGSFYCLGVFDARLDEAAFTTEPLGKRALKPGYRNLTAVLTIKNGTASPQTFTWSDFMPAVRDSDGEKVAYMQAMLKATRDEVAGGTLAPGEEARIRFFFPLPDKLTGKTLVIAEGKGVHITKARLFAFDVSNAK